MKNYLKIALFGFLTWLVPFVVSFFFFMPDHTLAIDEGLFKSIMIVIGSLTGAVLLVLYFKNVSSDYLRHGVIVGLIWLAINLALDFLILMPMSHMAVSVYLSQIGLRYLTIPIMTIVVGYILTRDENDSQKISGR
ncbi:MAG: hypothetical protein HY036_09290 [Nitrospirae bacterium]|nr:hypothetical protein [Nitrospirota bacterium]